MNMHPPENQIVTYPASMIQEQFWVVQQIHPESSAYNSPALFRIRGSLNLEALEKSFLTLLKLHESLRSNFISMSERLMQVVRPVDCYSLHIETFDSFSAKEKKNAIRKAIDSFVSQPFDLLNDPLMRVRLYKEEVNSYSLVLVFHHSITDLHSKKDFSKHLSDLYDFYCGQSDKSLGKNFQNYSDYSAWQHTYLLTEQYKENVSFWKKLLVGKRHYLNLPIDKQRPAIQDLTGDAIFFSFSSEETKIFNKFCRNNQGNIFLLCLAAYAVLLYRYSGQHELIVGVPFSNRRLKGHKDTLGCFVNALPLPITIPPEDISFIDLLKQIRITLLDAHRNQEVPYELLVKEIQPERDPSYNALFQVGFTFEPPVELVLGDCEIVSEKIHNHGAQLDLFANLWEQNNAIHGMFEYDTDLFEAETVERYVEHYKSLLNVIVKESERPVSRLSFLSEAEKNRIVIQWNNTKAMFPDSFCLHHLFEKQVDTRPDAIACIFEQTQLTYRELDERANRLAHYLSGKKICTGDRVAVYIDRSLDMLVAILGILKSGAAYIPLDPDFPIDRIAFMLDSSGSKVVLANRKTSHQLSPVVNDIICINTDWSAVENCSNERLDFPVSQDDLAYVIYTSGSTGKPKGVQVHHQAVVNFLTSMADTPGLTKKDILLAVTTISFDISVLELFLPLAVGGRVVIAPQMSVADGQQLKSMIAEQHITVMQATPTTWHLLIAEGWEKTENFTALCGGEPMPADLSAELLQRAGSVWNLYGPTETTIWSTCHRIDKNDSAVFVGRPIANTQTYIVDNYGEPTPIGVAGELLIGGTGVTKGYLNRPDLTDEKFTPDTFSNIPGQKLYHTGDMATYMPDGRIKIHGRVDQQIKLRGYRIELGEIEIALLSCPEVEQAAVLVKEVGGGDQRLVAYYTSEENNKSAMHYRTVLQSKLPRYMVPSFFMQLEQMPLTANGKIDRAALPVPNQVPPEDGRPFTQASNETERILCAIWNDVLKVGTVGINDNFFDLGGNSLLCLQALAAIEKKLKVKAPTVKFFQYPTVASFAGYLLEGSMEEKKDVTVEKQATLRRKALRAHQRRSLQGKV